MPVLKNEYMNDIIYRLSVARLEFASNNTLGKYDSNGSAEDFCGGLLNLIFDWNLQNLNYVIKNAPGIDLIDNDKGIIVQVSSVPDHRKIQESLDKLITKFPNMKNYHFYMMIITKKQSVYLKPFNTHGIQFEKESDIWDIDDLLKEIQKLPTEKIEQIYVYLKKEHGALNRILDYSQGENQFSIQHRQKFSCKVTIWSPVNVEVFLNDKRHPVLKVDHNKGFDYCSNTITAGEEFTLIFSAKGFEKEVLFDMPSGGKMEYHLEPILTDDEIAASYDRDEAVRLIKTDPTGYSFEQIGVVGKEEDIDLLRKTLISLSADMTETDQHRSYLIARCSVALGKLCINYSSLEKSGVIFEIYDKYPAKKQYGYYFDNILRELRSSLYEKFRTENQELLTLAEMGDAEAQYKIGKMYSDKTSVLRNYDKAFFYYLKSAEGGNVDAMMQVAVLYHVGLGCGGKDTVKEQFWYRKAMEAGSDMAIYCLANALDEGHFDHGRMGKTEEEKNAAESLYKIASEKGISKASKALAFKHWREHNEKEAEHWFRIGAMQGDAECQLHLAMFLYHHKSDEQILSEQEEAFFWYMKAAEQNHSIAKYGAARCLFYGIGTDKNESAAFDLILQASKSGNVPAQEVLSIMYGRGLGTHQDSQKSEYWYRKANDLESAEDYKKNFFDHVKMLTESYPVFDENYW